MDLSSVGGAASARLRSVAYVRMSTEHQDLSIGIQLTAIRAYADLHNLELVRVYEDAGKSGMHIAKRLGMKQLLRDVLADPRPFDVVLVYDVSRWGRFQDTDAAAYYEYTCRLQGAEVIYVQEPFGSNQEPMTALIKALKRTMAAEYSRELGVKCRAGQDRATYLGFQMGSLPNIGIRREAVDREGNRRPLLWRQRKGIQSERISWVLGPPEEVELVQRVFRMYAEENMSIKGVAVQLRAEGVLAARGTAFSESIVNSLLRCEAFTGNFVWGRDRLVREMPVKKRPETRADGVLNPIIDADLWRTVQEKLWRRRKPRRDKERMIQDLRDKLKENPELSTFDIEVMGLKSRKAYSNAFGSVTRALELAGRDTQQVRRIHDERKVVSVNVGNAMQLDLIELLRGSGIRCQPHPHSRLMYLNEQTSLRLQLTWPRRLEGDHYWYMQKASKPESQLVLVAQMAEDRTAIQFRLFSDQEFRQASPWLGRSADTTPSNRISNSTQLVAALTARLRKPRRHADNR